MTFRRLSAPAKLLIAGMSLAGFAALTWGFFVPTPKQPAVAAIYLILAFAVAAKRVAIHPRVATLSLGFMVVLGAIFTCGVDVAMAAAALNQIAGFVIRPKGQDRPPLWATAYNVGSTVVAALAAGLTHERLAPAGTDGQWSTSLAWAFLLTVAVYFVIQAFAIGLISTITQLRLPARRWWAEIVATAPTFYLGGATALAIDAAFQYVGYWVFATGVPLAYTIHRSFASQAEKHEEELARLEGLASAYLSVVDALSNAIDTRDHGTYEHARRVQPLATEVARRVGLAGEQLEAVRIGAVLHDIGKIAVPDHVLRKPGGLTDAEFALVKRHPIAGEAILRPIDFGPDVATLVRHHHEKLDGSGYPDGLSGDQIPIGARVLSAIDVYDALTSDRAYRKAWTSERAIAYLRDESNTSFDARAVDALAAAVSEGVFHAGAEGDHHQRPATGGRVAGRADDQPLHDSHLADTIRRQLLRQLVAALAGHWGARACAGYLVVSRHEELEVVACSGGLPDALIGSHIRVGTGVSGRAAQSGQVVRAADAGEEFVHLSDGALDEVRSASMTAFPVLGPGGDVLGVLSIFHSVDGTAPTDFEDAFGAALPVLDWLLDTLTGPGGRLSPRL